MESNEINAAIHTIRTVADEIVDEALGSNLSRSHHTLSAAQAFDQAALLIQGIGILHQFKRDMEEAGV